MSDETCKRLPYRNLTYYAPDTLPTGVICRQLRIPDDWRIRAAVDEVLGYLGLPGVWEASAGVSDADMQALMSGMLYRFSESDGSCMIGAIVPFAGANIPANMLECDGTEYSREDFPDLYAVLDAVFKLDEDTFVVPDLHGRVVLGAGVDYPVGQAGGSATVALTVNEMPSHTHVQTSHNHDQQAHSHNSAPHSHALTDPQHSHGMNHGHVIQARSSSAAGTNAELMRSNGTGTDADVNSGASTLNPTGSASTGISIGSGIATIDNTIAANLPATATNQNTGGGNAHPNMQPYRALRMVIVAR